MPQSSSPSSNSIANDSNTQEVAHVSGALSSNTNAAVNGDPHIETVSNSVATAMNSASNLIPGGTRSGRLIPLSPPSLDATHLATPLTESAVGVPRPVSVSVSVSAAPPLASASPNAEPASADGGRGNIRPFFPTARSVTTRIGRRELGVNPSSNLSAPFPEVTSMCVNDGSSEESRPSKRVLDAIRHSLLGPDASEFADVVLSTTDGVHLPACRALLAIRSPYFRKMFFLPFVERDQRTIPVNVKAAPLREVLHFAYTDTSPLLQAATLATSDHRDNNDINEVDFRPRLSRRNSPHQPSTPLSSYSPLVLYSHSEIFGTDGNSLLGKRRYSQDRNTDPPSIAALIELLHAADYVQISALAESTIAAIRALIDVLPRLACEMYEALHSTAHNDDLAKLQHQAATMVRQNPRECFGVPDWRTRVSVGPRSVPPPLRTGPANAYSVQILSESAFDAILADSDIFSSETYLFEALFAWATGALVTDLCTSVGTRALAEARNTDRWPAALRLATRIDLERLKPSFLRDYVLPSGLVPLQRVQNTFMHQALEAERGRPFFDNFRGGSRWPGGMKKVCATSFIPVNYPLQSPWFNSGRHEWTFRIIHGGPCLWLGVTARIPPRNAHLFFDGSAGWAYSTCGRVLPRNDSAFRHKAGPVGPVVRDGDSIRLILNLTRVGTLTVVTPNNTICAFSNLFSKAKRFIPVAALSAPAEVELMTEKHYM